MTMAPSRIRRREETHRLFERSVQESEQERARTLDEIVRLNMGVAESVAHRYRNRGERIEDLEQVAYLGLVKAVRGFDPARGKDFLTYAVPTVDGELKRHFRDRVWSVRPPRRIQTMQAKIATASEDLCQSLGRAPSVEELAEAIEVTEEDVLDALGAEGCFTPASLDLAVGETETAVMGDLLGEEDPDYARVEAHVAVRPLLERLYGRDAFIVRRRFIEGATQREIAGELGITQMQVSRLISRILAQLRPYALEDSA